MSRWSRVLIWCVVVVFFLCLGATLCLGIHSMQNNIAAVSASAQANGEEADPIAAFKTVRQQLRAMQKAQLNDVAHDSSSDAELVAMAQRQLLELCTREEQETTLEGVLAMQGWKNPVVTVHADSVNVLLQQETITQQECSVILDLVCRETGAMSGNVKIIPIN